MIIGNLKMLILLIALYFTVLGTSFGRSHAEGTLKNICLLEIPIIHIASIASTRQKKNMKY